MPLAGDLVFRVCVCVLAYGENWVGGQVFFLRYLLGSEVTPNKPTRTSALIFFLPKYIHVKASLKLFLYFNEVCYPLTIIYSCCLTWSFKHGAIV